MTDAKRRSTVQLRPLGRRWRLSTGPASPAAGRLSLGHLGQLLLVEHAVVICIGSRKDALHSLANLVLGQLAVLVGIERHIAGDDFFHARRGATGTTRPTAGTARTTAG